VHSLIVSNIKLKSGSVHCKEKISIASLSFTIRETILKCPSQQRSLEEQGDIFRPPHT
jgi:hypothetical protein